MPRYRRTRVALAALAAVLTAACTVDGKPGATQPDLATLDVGPWGIADALTEPRNDNEAYGRIVESVRMGEAVIDPIESDPTLKFGLGNSSSVPLPTPDKALFLAQPVRSVLDKRGMLAGFAVAGADRDIAPNVAVGRARLLTVILLRFPDAAAAERVAAEIDTVDTAVSTENVAVKIPDHAGAHAHWRPTVPTLAATLATGPFVVSLLVGDTKPDLPTLTALTRAALDAQVKRLRDFQPTPRDEIAKLPLDTDGMLARMLPEAPGVWPYPTVIEFGDDANAGWRTGFLVWGVVYGPRASHRWGPWEKEDGVGGMVIAVNGGNSLVRHVDAVAARQSYLDSVEELTDPGQREAAAPKGIPDARCVESLTATSYGSRYACHLLYGSYQAIIFGRTLQYAHQKTAAQYALLLRSE